LSWQALQGIDLQAAFKDRIRLITRRSQVQILPRNHRSQSTADDLVGRLLIRLGWI
jgi:hypothetical protein